MLDRQRLAILRKVDRLGSVAAVNTPRNPVSLSMKNGMLSKATAWARGVKRDVLAIHLAVRDPRTPWYARAVAAVVVAYALSPIDLIPDFVPVLGYLDDLIIVPFGILLVVRLIPAELLAEHRATVDARQAARPVSYVAGAFMVGLWIAAGVALCWWLGPRLENWLG